MIKPKTVWWRSQLLVINRCVTYHCIFYPINLTKQELCNSRRFAAARSYDALVQVYDHDIDSPRLIKLP